MSLRAFKKAIIVYGKHNIFFVMGRCSYASKIKGTKSKMDHFGWLFGLQKQNSYSEKQSS